MLVLIDGGFVTKKECVGLSCRDGLRMVTVYSMPLEVSIFVAHAHLFGAKARAKTRDAI